MASSFSVLFGKQVWRSTGVLLLVASVQLILLARTVFAGPELQPWEVGPTVLSPTESDDGLKALFEATTFQPTTAVPAFVRNTVPPSDLLNPSRVLPLEVDSRYAQITKDFPSPDTVVTAQATPVISLELMSTSQINFSDVTSTQLWHPTVSQDYSGRTEAIGAQTFPTLGTTVSEVLGTEERLRVSKKENVPLGQCREKRLAICRNAVPYQKTTLPNLVGDRTYHAVNSSLPFFQLLLKTQCSRRLLQLVCSILEPKCNNFRPIPPCRKFCRVSVHGCVEYIPATLPMSSVFACERYPDSNDPNVCVNLARNEECLGDEFQCPDKTCIPRDWYCDGVRDCLFALDEGNCTASRESIPCTSEEFRCDRKCVPERWRCDGEKDCQDGSDEANCGKKTECGKERFQCADGHGCIPRRWVCDGKAECRDGSDEKQCAQHKGCSPGDFRCSDGICVPEVWCCDGQADCKDGSDEQNCPPQRKIPA